LGHTALLLQSANRCPTHPHDYSGIFHAQSMKCREKNRLCHPDIIGSYGLFECRSGCGDLSFCEFSMP
jgi:hypothetical protein